MTNVSVSKSISNSRRDNRSLPLLAAGLASVVLLWPIAGLGAPEGPFDAFLGSWRGSGDITADDGHKERITCRAAYSSAEGGSALTQSLVCASDSYRFNVECYVESSGGALQGHWQETTRNAQGNLTGRVAGGDFQGSVSGPGFTATIAMQANARRQVVSIRPTAGGVKSLEITLARQG